MRFHATASVLWVIVFTGSAGAQGRLEVPSPNSVVSGIGVISGWHCTARRIEVLVDNNPIPLLAGSGTDRLDTREVCGHSSTGFSLLLNWNNLPKGCFGCRFHTVQVLADGFPFAATQFQAEDFGVEFMTGKSALRALPNFPELGSLTWLQWDEARQNFSIYLTASRQVSVDGTYYGAVRTGAQNPVCGPFPPDRVFTVKHGSFTVGFANGMTSLSVQYADGSMCRFSESVPESSDSRVDGYIHAVFSGEAARSCPEYPGGLRVAFNPERLIADSQDGCMTAHVMAAK